MNTAQRILLMYGTLSIVYGMTLGLALSSVRMSHPTGPRHLVTAHLSALMQGSMHLGLSVAFGFATLSPWILTASAGAIACGSALFVGGVTANWLTKIDDHFAARSPGWYLLSASAPFHLGGALVVLVGVARAAL
jgi:disulfide bond formation protein DsbB